jgi:uncharacterized protein involved in exopolysaccharide biosynthesis
MSARTAHDVTLAGLPQAAQDDDEGRSLSELLAVLRRRWALATGSFVLLLAAGLAVAALIPAVYRSSATILIKEQEIPPDMVRSTITSFADERIQVITQQVMTRGTLLELVDRHGLYGRARQRESSEEILDRMRRDIRITPISAEVTDRRTGTPARATIAFSLSYDSEVPGNAQKIANELVTLFLNENLKNRQQKAAETTVFLDEELQRIGAEVSDTEQRLADFKRRHPGGMPEATLANQLGAERLQSELQRLERDIAFADERQAALEQQLAQTRPHVPVAGVNGAVMDPEERLRTLEVQLISLLGLYSDDHPDVRRLKREIAAFRTETGLQNAAIDRESRLAELRQALATLRQRYAEDHPDIVALRRAYSAVESAMRSGAAAGVAQPAVTLPRRPENPAYLNLQQQVQAAAAQRLSLRTEREAVRTRLEQFEQRLAQAPEVEREFLELTRDLDSARAQFREMRAKQMQAEVAEQLERSRKAERFTLIEPPVFPERPLKPNRGAIALAALALALLGALGATALAEALDPRLHGARALARTLGVPVLAAIPAVAPPGRVQQGRRWRLVLAGGAAALLVLALGGAAAVHWLVMPLDVAWYSLLRRMGGG